MHLQFVCFCFLLHLTFKLVIVFCIYFVVGRLDQLNYIFFVFYGSVTVSRVKVDHYGWVRVSVRVRVRVRGFSIRVSVIV